MEFSDLETGSQKSQDKTTSLPGTSKPQDFGANPGYQTSNLPSSQSINSVENSKK